MESRARQEALFAGREAHLWWTRPEEITSPSLLEAYGALMSLEEHTREERYKFARHRHQHRVTRALLRSTLSLYADAAPETWRFETNEYGRPFLPQKAGEPPLHFNLSHTDGMIVLAIASCEIGVDVEQTSRKNDPIQIADRFFSPHEIQCLHQLPKDAQKHRFFQYWTLGEAYIKARGMGLAIPLDQFTFHIQPQQPISISFGPKISDQPARWQFAQLFPSPKHSLAVAIAREQRPPLTIWSQQVTPLDNTNPTTPTQLPHTAPPWP